MPPEAAAAATTATTGTEGTAAAGAAAAAPWYAGKITEAADIGYLQNKGWHDKPANDVALEILKSYRGVEKLVGAPPDQVVRWPKDAADEAGWQTVRDRLGVPKDAKDYDFSGVKYADGKVVDDAALLDAIRATAANLKLPKDAAPEIAQAIVKQNEAHAASREAERQALITADKQALAKSWGANADANKFVAVNAMKAVMKATGLDDSKMAEGINAIEQALGYVPTMQMFLAIGQKIGEDRFVTSETGRATGGVLTREQAVARMAELSKDRAWGAKWMAGDKDAVREKNALDLIIAGTG